MPGGGASSFSRSQTTGCAPVEAMEPNRHSLAGEVVSVLSTVMPCAPFMIVLHVRGHSVQRFCSCGRWPPGCTPDWGDVHPGDHRTPGQHPGNRPHVAQAVAQDDVEEQDEDDDDEQVDPNTVSE